MHSVTLEAPDDVRGWLHAAARLAGAGVPAQAIHWHVAGGTQDLFSVPQSALPEVAPIIPCSALRALARLALCHRDPERFTLLYRLLLRTQTNPALLENRADADTARAQNLAKAVGRDRHKMTAFVRFRAVSSPDGKEIFVAWFEPDHHIVRLTAPFFMRRFASQRFSLLTPEASAHWDGETLHHGAGARRADAPGEDRLEDLWLTYYANIFNPARLKVSMMKSEMPMKYWRNLPEAALIAPLIRTAQARASAMLEAAPAPISRKRGRYVPPENEDALAQCTRCPLHGAATQAVPGEGPEGAALMIVGEQPGDREDIEGRPFVGPAGKLLDEALRRIGVERSALYITNAVKHFHFAPRGRQRLHKTPTPEHVAACAPWLARERGRIRPRVLLALGNTAAHALTEGRAPLESLRGRVMTLPDGTALVVARHPAALLRLTRHEDKKRAWGEFLGDVTLAWTLAQQAGEKTG